MLRKRRQFDLPHPPPPNPPYGPPRACGLFVVCLSSVVCVRRRDQYLFGRRLGQSHQGEVRYAIRRSDGESVAVKCVKRNRHSAKEVRTNMLFILIYILMNRRVYRFPFAGRYTFCWSLRLLLVVTPFAGCYPFRWSSPLSVVLSFFGL